MLPVIRLSYYEGVNGKSLEIYNQSISWICQTTVWKFFLDKMWVCGQTEIFDHD